VVVDAAPFVDTNVLLYLLSGDTAKSSRAEAALSGGIVVSVQVLNEFANVARRKLGFDWDEIDDVLSVIRRVADVRPLTLETHQRGLALAARYRFGIDDAMIVSAALLAGCARLLSEDLQSGQRIDDRLTVMNPFR
jgi:predicted nucleic acid-binding protein